ncbi:MAG: hypothetical protein R3320_15255, partial [Nitriliruptorales bacterium]|nr:hypothetical protein [Nitriliruptorales bacterium]
MGQDQGKRRKHPEVPQERAAFRSLLATNPNYFGTFEDLPFEPVLPKQADSAYEELTCLGYEPRRAELEATIAQKLGFGYGGGPCTSGSREYVRFYVDEGAGWVDEGLAGIRVTDLAIEDDCEGEPTHPLHHTVTVGYSPRRRPCTQPQYVRVRAILSWDMEPPAGTPNHVPVWGSVLECDVQIAPATRFAFSDLIDKSKLLEVLELPDYLVDIVDQPIEVPQPPLPPVTLLAELYRDQEVGPHRFAMKHALAATSGLSIDIKELQNTVQLLETVDLDLVDILGQIEETSGDVSYEELECDVQIAPATR